MGHSEILSKGKYKDHNFLPLKTQERQGQMSHDNIESIQLLPTEGICLFPQPNYCGKMFTVLAGDSGPHDFAAQSVIVVSGVWTLFAKAGCNDGDTQTTISAGDQQEKVQAIISTVGSVKHAPSGFLKVSSTFGNATANPSNGTTTQGQGVQPESTLSFELNDKPSIELILDASGSMENANLGNDTRMAVAKNVLRELIQNFPTGIPIALRVFGPTTLPGADVVGNKPGSQGQAGTALLIPLAPLPDDKKGILTQINQISGRDYTPIADSIDRVTKDMAGAKGDKLIVLVTDGAETCGGNVIQSIEQLHNHPAGFEVVMNVVGIDAGDNRETFEHWAKAGHGEYYDATDASSLLETTTKALKKKYDVFFDYKSIISGFIDGEPVELKARDAYAIEFDTTKQPRFLSNVQISPGKTTEVFVNRG